MSTVEDLLADVHHQNKKALGFTPNRMRIQNMFIDMGSWSRAQEDCPTANTTGACDIGILCVLLAVRGNDEPV